MRIYKDFCEFKPWSGAVSTYERIEREGLLDDLENILDDIYPEGMSETEVNDLLWFESDTVYDWLGIRTEEQIREEISEAEADLATVLHDAEIELSSARDDDERAEIIDCYNKQVEDFENLIAELKEELEAI